MQNDKSAQQRWLYQGVSENPCGEHPLFQAGQRNAIEYNALQFDLIQYCSTEQCKIQDSQFFCIDEAHNELWKLHFKAQINAFLPAYIL